MPKIMRNGVEYGSNSGDGSLVTITPTLNTGIKIADFTIDGVPGSLYAPQGGGSLIRQIVPNLLISSTSSENVEGWVV